MSITSHLARPLVVLCVAVLMAVGLNTIPAASADTLTVTKTEDTNDGRCSRSDCSLREAVIAANANPGPDVIVVPRGTYLLSIAGTDEDAAASGDLDITDDLTIRGENMFNTVISGDEIDRVFDVLGSARVNFEGMVITNGFVEDDSSESSTSGGGIRNKGGRVTITDSLIIRNRLVFGGGAGIYNEGGTVRVVNSTISDNTTDSDTGAAGGGIRNQGRLIISKSTISENSAGDAMGGGIAHLRGRLTVMDSTISKNFAQFGGGGIANLDRATIINSTISMNTADSPGGGGILNEGRLTLLDSTISGNKAMSDGGGILNASWARIVGSEITSNSAGDTGGGIFNMRGSVIRLINTLVAANTAPNDPNCHGMRGCGFSDGG